MPATRWLLAAARPPRARWLESVHQGVVYRPMFPEIGIQTQGRRYCDTLIGRRPPASEEVLKDFFRGGWAAALCPAMGHPAALCPAMGHLARAGPLHRSVSPRDPLRRSAPLVQAGHIDHFAISFFSRAIFFRLSPEPEPAAQPPARCRSSSRGTTVSQPPSGPEKGSAPVTVNPVRDPQQKYRQTKERSRRDEPLGGRGRL